MVGMDKISSSEWCAMYVRVVSITCHANISIKIYDLRYVINMNFSFCEHVQIFLCEISVNKEN